MTALIRYQLADLIGSQRWVAPFLTYLAFLGFLYQSDAGPAVPAFGVSALVLVPVLAWLTRQIFSVEDDAVRQVSAAAAGGPVRVQLALLGSAALAGLAFVAVAVGWAALANHAHVRDVGDVVGGVVIHLAFGAAGIGLGAVVARPIIQAPGLAALTIVGVCVLGLIVPWSPLLHSTHALQTDPVHHFRSQLLPWMTALLAMAAAAMVASVLAAARE